MRLKFEHQRRRLYTLVFLALPGITLFFLWLEHQTHFEFLLHLAAIPLEILLGAVLVERWIARKEKEGKRQQLMYLKSYLFRSEMRQVFISNFEGLESPSISLAALRETPLSELTWFRDRTRDEPLRYKSPADQERVVLEYVRARRAFRTFMEWAASNDFEPIFHDMIYILHFIEDVEHYLESNPGKLFVEAAASHPRLREKMDKILRDGVVKFFDYVIELRQVEPDVLEELLDDYILSSKIRA